MAKKKKKKTRKKTNFIIRKRISIVLAIICIFLAVLLLILFLFSRHYIGPAKKIEKFQIRDECSRILGNLVHVIEDKGSCEIRCKNECGIRSKDFVRSEFRKSNDDACNSCSCECV